MKKVSARFLTLLLTGIFLGIMLQPGTALSGPIKLSYANFPPAPTFPCVQMEDWKKKMETATKGKVAINTYPGGTLLGAKEMMDGVIAGQADIGCLCMAYQPGRFMITNATSLPLEIPNARVGSRVLWELFKKYNPKSFSKVKVLTMFTTAPANIMSKKPIRSIADMKGLDLRASGGAARILKNWGANPVGMPMPATPEALQKGVVQGLFSSLEVMKDFKFAEMCKYITRTETVIYPFAVVMNLDSWNALPEDVKKTFEDSGLAQAHWTGNYMDNHVAQSVKWSQTAQKVEVIDLSKEQKAEWNRLLNPITEAWIKDATEKGFSGKEIVAEIKSLTKKYSGK